MLLTDSGWRERIPGGRVGRCSAPCAPRACWPCRRAAALGFSHPIPVVCAAQPLLVLTPALPCPPATADDPSGRWKQALDFLAANARVARLVAVAALGAELAALGAACWLKAMYEVR